MAIITPFRGLTYNLEKIPDLGNVVAPPYDVIADKSQEEYHRKHAYNIIRLTLGMQKTGDSDWDNRYTRAADLFKRWESEAILVKSELPSIYLVSIDYDVPGEGERLTRWGFITLVRIEENGSGSILPHEKTFSYHCEDRFKLLRACGAQFSPVFGLYQDRHNIIIDRLSSIRQSSPSASFRYDGFHYNMWEITRGSVIRDIAAEMSPKSIIIADGHHRYTTAKEYRNLMRARHGRHSRRSYEYVMMYLSNLSDKGLTILPTHRLFSRLPDFDLESFFSHSGKWFDIISFPFNEPDRERVKGEFLNQLKGNGESNTSIGFFHHASREYHLLKLKSKVYDELEKEAPPLLAKLDVQILTSIIFQKILGIKKGDMDNRKIIQYESDTDKAMGSVLSGEYQMVFLLNPTKIDHILEVTRNAQILPRKSTYFYPKILSGLVLNKIDPLETLKLPRQ